MSTPIQIATHNPGKLKEFQALFGSSVACVASPKGWPAPEETGSTYRENAEIKARSLWNFSRQPALSDDSGLEILSLKDAPGVDSAIYGGEALEWRSRLELVLGQLKGQSDRRARFRAVLCYFDGGSPQFFEGIVEGEIALAPKGEDGFGYDPIFYSSELKMTFGEASTSDKEKVSHRARAAKEFLRWWTLKRA